MKSRGAILVALAILAAGCKRDEPSDVGAPTPVVPAAFFQEITADAGLTFHHRNGSRGRKYLPEIMGSGGSALDYDGDGRMDLYLVQSGALPGAEDQRQAVNRLFRNRPDGTFLDVTETAGVGDTGYGMGSVAADYDNDGDTDLYVVNFGPNVLYRNNGDGTFSDVTKSAGVGDVAWGSSAVFFDADRDGHQDLYVVNYLEFSVTSHIDCGTPSKGILSYCSPDVYAMAPDVFYRSNGDGTFSDATTEAGMVDVSGKGLGAVAGDLTGDGWPDLYVANDSTPNFLYVNDGAGVFTEQGVALGVSHNEDGMTEAGMGTDFGDLNGDGQPDLFVTNLSGETNALYLGGDGYFTYATRTAGLYAASFLPVGFGADLWDLDNDRDLDVVVANGHVIDNIALIDDAQAFAQPAQLFLNDGGGRLTAASAQQTAALAAPKVGRGTITLDYDNDGWLDLVITENNGPAHLYRNRRGSNRWIGFELRPSNGNRYVPGATVTVSANGRTLSEESRAGSSYQTSGDPRLHFGLGHAPMADVSVRWPSGQTVDYGPLAADRYHSLAE